MKQSLTVKGLYTLTFKNVETGETRTHKIENLVVDTGLAHIADLLGPQGSVKQGLNYIAIGDDATAVASGQTQLVNETFRKAVQSLNAVANAFYVSTFLGQTEGNGTINEVGIFAEANATTNNGILFSRVSTENTDLPLTKLNTETLTIDYQFTITNA